MWRKPGGVRRPALGGLNAEVREFNEYGCWGRRPASAAGGGFRLGWDGSMRYDIDLSEGGKPWAPSWGLMAERV